MDVCHPSGHIHNTFPFYDHMYIEPGCDNFFETEDVVQIEKINDDVSMDSIMQKAFSNVMCFSSSPETSHYCDSDTTQNSLSSDADDDNANEDFVSDSSYRYAKCLPTNEDLATWELLGEF